MATSSISFTHSSASNLPLKASDDARQTLRKIVTFCEAAALGVYKATSFTASQDPATGTVTLSGVDGVASTGSVALSNVGGTAASGTVTLSGVDGTAATGSVALSNVGGAFGSGTVTLAGGAGDTTVTIDGTPVGPVPFNLDDTVSAEDVADAINADVTLAPIVTAAASLGVITITADAKGVAGNYTLTASRTAGSATASGATLTGGMDGSVGVTVDGTLVTTNTTGMTDNDAATAVAAAIEADGTLGPLLAAVGSTNNVNMTWSTKGTVGNVTLASSSATGTATASGATFTGGADNTVTVTVDGTAVPTDTTTLSNNDAATAVAAALEADGTFAAKASASAGTNIVTIIWDTKGTVGNSKTLTAATTGGTATASGATLAGGAQGSVGVTINGTLATTDTTNLSDTDAATACAAAIEANGTLGPLLAAVGSTTNVNLTWGTKGVAGDAVTLSSTSATGTATSSGATFSGGADCTSTVTVAGTAVNTDTTALSNSAAATAVAAAVNADGTASTYVTASAASAVVTLTANVVGPVGNAIPFSSSATSGTATASGAFLSGGTATTYTL